MSSIKVYKKGRLQKQGCNIEGIIILFRKTLSLYPHVTVLSSRLSADPLRTDIRTGLLHNIMMPSMLHPCFLFYLHLTESLISCSSNFFAAHSIEFLQEFLGIHLNEFTDIWDRFFICSAILRNNLLDHTKS